ncbi:MAG: cation transporter [Bacillota bacterium]
MNTLSQEQAASREKTLMVALLLSMWAPLATGIAVVLSRSTTQLADFIRRSVELVALFVSWWVFRHLQRKEELGPEEKAALERIAGLCVAAALCCSGIVMLVLALSRLSTFQPGGNVYLGIGIAGLGLITNAWFWRRYTLLTNEHYSTVIDTQRQLYRAKAFVDLCVIVALAAVAVNPIHPVTRYIDVLGSVAVSFYLLWSGYCTARTATSQKNLNQVPGT